MFNSLARGHAEPSDFDPIDTGEEDFSPVPPELLPRFAERAISPLHHEKFFTAVRSAIAQGMTSKQTLKGEFGEVVCAALKSNNMPAPATAREILSFISKLDPADATGSTLPWRHAQCAPAVEELTLQG